MRERLLAVLQGRELDRVPLIMYDDLFPPAETAKVRALYGRQIGLLRWSEIYRIVTPNCRFVTEEFYQGETRCERTTLYTPAGSLVQVRAFEPVFNSGAYRKHYIEEAGDYEIFWAYLNDAIILDNYERYQRDAAELGENGLPLTAVERSPYQKLWVEWVGLERLSLHFADYPDRLEKTIELLRQRARKILTIAARSPAPLVDFPDNITAPAIGLKRFRQYCVPLYNELADLLAERSAEAKRSAEAEHGALVFVHADGDLQPLSQAIAESKLGGLDSFSPAPDNDTSVAQAIANWPGKRLFVNFPSSVHLRSYEEVRAEAEQILHAGGHTGRLEIQFSENVPLHAWRTSFQAIVDAVENFRP